MPWPPRAVAFAAVWVVALVTGELLVFHLSALLCAWRWPAAPALPTAAGTPLAAPVRVALVADPQLTDRWSYPGRPAALEWLTEYHADAFMARAFYVLQLYTAPQAVFFVGDLFDGGRDYDDDAAWRGDFARFRNIFRPRLRRPSVAVDVVAAPLHPIQLIGLEQVQLDVPRALPHTRQRRGPLLFFTAGNHDLGLDEEIVDRVRMRFVRHFGPTSYALTLNNVSFAVLDLLEMRKHGPYEYTNLPLRRMFDGLHSEMVQRDGGVDVLVEHIPFHRPPDSTCGPYRRSPAIKDAGGRLYYNMLTNRTTVALLDWLRPRVIFSGDDHDQCSHNHTLDVFEHTVGTFSPLMGNLLPSFGMLTAQKLSNGTALAYDVCFLPPSITILLAYAALCIVSLPAYLIAAAAVVQDMSEARLHLPSGGAGPGLLCSFVRVPGTRLVVRLRSPTRSDVRLLTSLAVRLLALYVLLHVAQWLLIWSVAMDLPDPASFVE